MAALLRDALMPNLVQTLEGSPALVHGGPFANIAHGCNSVMATRLGLKLADVVVTEAGFGADLGGEKFLDIKCRIGRAVRRAVRVVVATRARAEDAWRRGASRRSGREDAGAVARGVANLVRHVENMRKFGLPVVVGAEPVHLATPRPSSPWCATRWRERDVRDRAVHALGRRRGRAPPSWRGRCWPGSAPSAAPGAALSATRCRWPTSSAPSRARSTAPPTSRCPSRCCAGSPASRRPGFGDVPVCIAKTQYSFSADPTLLGAPEGHILPVRDVRLSPGPGSSWRCAATS